LLVVSLLPGLSMVKLVVILAVSELSMVNPLVVSRLVGLLVVRLSEVQLLVVILAVSELSMVNPLVGLFVVVGLSRNELLVVTIPTADPGIDIDVVVYGRICSLGESLYVVVVVQFRRPASHRM
jgi:hypothetical protein